MKLRPLDPVALMYHELRAPLGLMATAARSMADDAPDEEMRQRCEVIVRTAERMLRTAATVVDLDGGRDDAMGGFRPVPVIEELAASLAGLGAPLDLRVETADAFVAAGEAPRFEALLHSIVSNAMDHGDPDASIVVTVRASEAELTVDVANVIALVDTHRGRGFGTVIANALARGLGARLESSQTDDWHVSRITLPRLLRRAASYSPSVSTQSA